MGISFPVPTIGLVGAGDQILANEKAEFRDKINHISKKNTQGIFTSEHWQCKKDPGDNYSFLVTIVRK